MAVRLSDSFDTAGNLPPTTASGESRPSWDVGSNGNRGDYGKARITFTSESFVKTGSPYTINVAGVNYTLMSDDQYVTLYR